MPLLTLDDARLALGIDDADTSPDDMLQLYVDGITAVIEKYKGEYIDVRTVSERLQLWRPTEFVLRYVPVASITSLINSSDSSAWDLTTLTLNGQTGVVTVAADPLPCGTFTATYTAGYATPPANYKMGATVVLQHLWEAQRAAGQTGVVPGPIGPEEMLIRNEAHLFIRKAREWLGEPRVGLP